MRVVMVSVRVLVRAGDADDYAAVVRPGRRGEAEERQRQAAPRGGCWFHRVAVGPLRCPKPQNPIKTTLQPLASYFISSLARPVTSALIIEPRNHVTLDWVIDNVSKTLPDVPIHFHHGLKNEKLAQAISRVYPKVQLHNMGVENLSIGEYSNYMTQSSL